MMTLNSEILGLPIPDAGPVFATVLVIHILSGLTAVIAGALAATARKRPGRHPACRTGLPVGTRRYLLHRHNHGDHPLA